MAQNYQRHMGIVLNRTCLCSKILSKVVVDTLFRRLQKKFLARIWATQSSASYNQGENDPPPRRYHKTDHIVAMWQTGQVSGSVPLCPRILPLLTPLTLPPPTIHSASRGGGRQLGGGRGYRKQPVSPGPRSCGWPRLWDITPTTVTPHHEEVHTPGRPKGGGWGAKIYTNMGTTLHPNAQHHSMAQHSTDCRALTDNYGCVVLSDTVLCCGVVCSVVFSLVLLCCAVLCCAVLCCAMLCCAVLCHALLLKLQGP